MQKIENRSNTTPWSAHYSKIISRSGSVVTVEYYSAGKHTIQNVPYPARVMQEATYHKMIKSPTAPKGKEEKDSRRDDLEDRRDLPKGKKLTSIEQEVLDFDIDDPSEEVWNSAPEVLVKKRAKENPSRSLGGKVEKIKKVNEGIGDETTFTWAAFVEAATSAGLGPDDINAIKVEIHGNEMTVGIGESVFDRLMNISEEEVVYDAEGAQDDFQNAQESPEKKNSIKVGMSRSELNSSLVNLSSKYANSLHSLPRGTKITIVKMVNNQVSKVLPSTIIRVDRSNRGHNLLVKLVDKKVNLSVSSTDENSELMQNTVGNIVYISKEAAENTDQKINVNYQG